MHLTLLDNPLSPCSDERLALQPGLHRCTVSVYTVHGELAYVAPMAALLID